MSLKGDSVICNQCCLVVMYETVVAVSAEAHDIIAVVVVSR